MKATHFTLLLGSDSNALLLVFIIFPFFQRRLFFFLMQIARNMVFLNNWLLTLDCCLLHITVWGDEPSGFWASWCSVTGESLAWWMWGALSFYSSDAGKSSDSFMNPYALLGPSGYFVLSSQTFIRLEQPDIHTIGTIIHIVRTNWQA